MRYICVHGHFYQPPRENPYLEALELQDSAYPYHDWNERITAECYAPNATSRIMDAEGRILNLVPDVGRHDLHQYVANGFDIGLLDVLLVDNLLPLLGYLAPWAILAYYLMKYREIANPS